MMSALTHLYWRYVRPLRDEKGANMVEYGLLIALIGVLLIAAIGVLTGALDALFRNVATYL